jgi:hypothetical protein
MRISGTVGAGVSGKLATISSWMRAVLMLEILASGRNALFFALPIRFGQCQ